MAVNTETYTGVLDHAQRRNLLSAGWAFVRAWPILPGAIVALMVFTAVFAPLVAPSDSRKQSLADSRHPPVWFGNPELTERDIARGTEKAGLYRLGADELGRDVLTRVVFGARLSLQIVVVALTSGCTSGHAARAVRRILGRVDRRAHHAVSRFLACTAVHTRRLGGRHRLGPKPHDHVGPVGVAGLESVCAKHPG